MSEDRSVETSIRVKDEFDVTCVTCGEEILSWEGREARKWITEHKKKHSKDVSD